MAVVMEENGKLHEQLQQMVAIYGMQPIMHPPGL